MVALVLATALVASAEGAREEDVDDDVLASPASDAGFLATPPFPGREISNAFRGHLGTFVAPEADVGSGDVNLARSQLGLRVTFPVSERLALRLSGRVGTSRYRFHGDPAPGSPFLGNDLELYAARVAIEGAYRLEGLDPWLAEGEIWSLLGALSGGSRWEDGDLGSGLGARAALGVGYEIPGRLRLALGVSLRSSLEEGGIDPGPFFSLRWTVSERLTLRTHDLGLRVEYDLTPALELQLTGARASDTFRLRGRRGLPDDLNFRDRHLRAGAGFEWDLANWLRLGLEIGYVAERHLRVQGDDLGTLVSRRVDPSVVVDLGLELRL